ncbi:MAG TPA: transposase [Rectinemataceae bacterium]|nr:transposase [Rectinemataceae bacterium]
MRKPRELREGARYHVTARTNRKEMILDSSAMKELFLSVVKRAKAKYSFRIENFCIMGNHFHFVIMPGKGVSLSALMQWIMSVFAMAYNKIRGFTGHVWGGRFFSRIISGLRELVQVFEYIDENPVKASQVPDRRDWRYGGLWHNHIGCREIVDEMPEWAKLLFPEHMPLLLGC